ncbi:MAG: glyoxalase [Alphaproteobacteria bacterium]|nr:MAG: glyoxalase [Alphaproteobacteria bacterium]
MKLNGFYPVLCVEDVERAAHFYVAHFGFKPVFESDWYIHLRMEGRDEIELAFVKATHESVPESCRRGAQGIILSFEVEDANSLYASFMKKGLNILQDLRDEPWGQRHFILSDPCGVTIDVVQVIEATQDFQTQHLI